MSNIRFTGDHNEWAQSLDEQMRILHAAIHHEPIKPTTSKPRITLDGHRVTDWVSGFSNTGLFIIAAQVVNRLSDTTLIVRDASSQLHMMNASSARTVARPDNVNHPVILLE
jgi:hypothetical protein